MHSNDDEIQETETFQNTLLNMHFFLLDCFKIIIHSVFSTMVLIVEFFE